MITLCAWCRKIRNEKGHWEIIGDEYPEATFTHGICPECLREQNPELYDEMLKPKNEDK